MIDARMPVEERMGLIKKYYRYMDRYMSHVLYGVDENRWPVLEMGLEGGTYTNVGGNGPKVIHLDLGPDVYLESETDFVNACEVFIGHEVQHIRSTAAKAWVYGLNNGKIAICQEHLKHSGGKPRILNNTRQADSYIKELHDSGYMVSKRSLEQLVHFIMNSVEDGRIERILCVQRPGFQKKLVAHRGMEWVVNDACAKNAPGFDTPLGYIQNILNQVLCLSTMSIYQKGFVLKSAGDSRAFRQMQELIPLIAKGVSSENCKGGMEAAVGICRALAMDILEACRMTPLEQLLQKLMQKYSENASYSADSLNEETDGTPGKSLFGKSDLVVEVEDDVFDRMEEEQKKSGGDKGSSSGMAVILKRNHPKEGRDGSPGDKDREGQKKPSGTSSHGGDGQEKPSGTSGHSGDGQDRKEKAETSGREEARDGGMPEKGEESPGGASGEKKENSDGKESSAAGRDPGQDDDALDEHAIHAIIRESMSDIEPDVAEASREAFRDAGEEKKPPIIKAKEDGEPDTSKVEAMYDRMPEGFLFREIRRSYVPDRRMPMDMANKAELLKRKLIQILKNQCEPDMRERRSGILDPAFLYRLAMGNMECFIQKGMESSFNGCAYILMDRSGSMGSGHGSKFWNCCNAVAFIEHAFSSILPLKIASFHATSHAAVIHEVIKNWSENLPYNGSYNFYLNRHSQGGNKDGYSIRIAATELLSQPYEEKILIVLSDGLPSSYENGLNAGLSDVKSAVRYTRKQGIDVVSIFFGDRTDEEHFRDIYGRKNCIVTKPENIGDELFKVMKNLVVNMV